MARTDWTLDKTVKPEDMNQIGQEINDLSENVGDMSAVPTAAKDAAGAITELFTSVSDGKALVASAITDKGVPTDASDTFTEMADNIEAIPVGPDTSDATVVAGDILAPKTAYGSAGTKLTGTMVDRGNMSFTPGPTAQTIPAGKHGGGGQVAAVTVPADKVLTGTTIAGTAGTMPHRSGDTAALASSVSGTTLRLRASAGYRNGTSDNVTIADPNFIAANIRDGVSVFGLVGTLKTGGVNLSAPTERLTTSPTMVPLKSVTVTYSGVVRISFQLNQGAINRSAYGQIYKNGVPVGTLRFSPNPSTWYTFTEDFACSHGDVFEVYCRRENIDGSGQCTVRGLTVQSVLVEQPQYNGIVNVD